MTAADRQREYEDRWQRGGLAFLGAFGELLFSREANETAAGFIRSKIAAVVRDPVVAGKLSPRQIVGCKRLCIDSGYYQTYNRQNVTLVDVSDSPIEEITEHGLLTQEAAYELDCIVFATGFDAMTGALLKVAIRGKDGLSLQQKWAEGPRTYLGLMTAGFPNLFTITGPGSPSVLTNMLPSIEQHVDWIGDCIGYLGKHGMRRIEPTFPAEDDWVAHVNEVAGKTLYSLVQFMVSGRECRGQTPCVHALSRLSTLCREVQRGGREGLCGVRTGRLNDFCGGMRVQEPVGLRMNRRQQRDSGPYFAKFSLNSDGYSPRCGKIWPRSFTFSRRFP